MNRRLVVLPSRGEVEETVANELRGVIAEAIGARGRANIVVTGGTVGIGTLAALRRVSSVEPIDWHRVHVWWGDERFVAADDVDRNDRQAMDALFAHVDIPAENLHRFPASHGQSVEDGRDSFRKDNPNGFPTFDVVLNGIGPDGHVASLFPHRDHGETEDVIAIRDSPKPPAERLSLTFRVLNNSHNVWIVAAGEDKAEAIQRLMEDDSPERTPATALSRDAGVVVWADTAAASRVTN